MTDARTAESAAVETGELDEGPPDEAEEEEASADEGSGVEVGPDEAPKGAQGLEVYPPSRTRAYRHNPAHIRPPPQKNVDFVRPQRPEEAVTHLQRLFWVSELIQNLLWRPGFTPHELAAVWKCSHLSIDKMVTEARNAMRLGFDKPEVMREQLVANAMAIGRAAMLTKQYGVALKAGEAVARILGLEAPQRVELSGGMTPVTKEDGERAMRAALGLPVPAPTNGS